jgi:hypothetical protein
MGPLTALVLATPIFGLSLTPPQLEALPTSLAPVAQFEATLVGADELDAESGRSTSDGEATADQGSSGPAMDKQVYVAKLRKRAKLAKIHRTLGITTWALTGLAVIAGGIQYHNLYGGTRDDNPCVKGNAWLGQGQCSGTPWFHALTGFAAGAAYFSTLSLAIAMPDPDNAAKGDSKYAKNLRTHKALRWVHLTGMVAQMAIGIVLANPRINGGLDRANDYSKMKTLSLVHLGSGLMTLGALSWAGTIMY